MRALPRPLQWYLHLITLGALILLVTQVGAAVASAPTWLRTPDLLPAASLFLLLTYLCERLILPVGPAVSQSLTTAAHIALILLFPPPLPLATALLVILVTQVVHTQLPLYKRLFNIAHYTLIVGLTDVIFVHVAAPGRALRPDALVASLPALALLLFVYYVLDVGPMLGLLALLQRRSPWHVWQHAYRQTLVPELAASVIGLLAAALWLDHPVLLALFAVPVATVRLAFRAVAAAERRGAHLEVVLEVGQRLHLRHALADLLHPVADAARIIASAPAVAAYLPDPDRPDLMERLVLVPPDAALPVPSRVPPPAGGAGLRQGDPLLQAADDGTHTLQVALERPGRDVLGLLSLHGLPAPPDPDVRRALTILATQAAIALDHARLHQQVLAQASEDGLTGLLNHRAFHTRLEHEAARAQRGRHALALVMVDLDDFGDINNTYGHPAGDATLVAVAAAVRASGRATDVAARYGGDELTYILPETGVDEALAVAARVQAAIAALRITYQGQTIHLNASVGLAVLPLHATTPAELIRAADQAVYAAKHRGKGRVGRPEESLLPVAQDPHVLAQELEHANLATVEALAKAVDAKDAYTRGHSRRVSTYAAAVAAALSWAEPDVARVRLAGLLHDVGKIGVPDAILTKPGRLTEEEYAVIKQHPVIGEQMLAAVPYLRVILPAVRHHHERWAGGGYPDGLVGPAIPPDASILMVVDAFDAMTSSRTYRAALPVDEARRRLQEGCGTQFDPHVVAAFERAISLGLIPQGQEADAVA